jgi:hypothetical protein
MVHSKESLRSAALLQIFRHDPCIQEVTKAMVSPQHLHSGNCYLPRGVVNSPCSTWFR